MADAIRPGRHEAARAARLARRPAFQLVHIPLSPAFGPRKVNAYLFPLVPGGPWALVDPGPAEPAARLALSAAISLAGLSTRQLKLVLVTGLRAERAGMAWELAQSSGAALAVRGGRHALVGARTAEEHRAASLVRAAAWAGAPSAQRDHLRSILSQRSARLEATLAGNGAGRVMDLRAGGQLRLGGHLWELRDYRWPVAPPQLELWHGPSRSLLAPGLLRREGPLVLPFRVATDTARPDSANLEASLAAWRRLGREAVDLVLADQGAPIRSHRILIARRLGELRAELDRLLALIGDGPSRPWTLFEGMGRPTREEGGLPEDFGHFLVLLQQLERRRLITRRPQGGEAVFSRAG